MGCTFYPQRSSFTQALEEEAISVVCKLRNHPSLVLWSGNNEDDCALRWSLQPFNINRNQDVVSRKVLPAVIYEFDPTRPYLPSSPTTAKRYMKEEVLTNIYQKTIYGVPEDITKTNSIRMLPAALSVKSAITAALI